MTEVSPCQMPRCTIAIDLDGTFLTKGGKGTAHPDPYVPGPLRKHEVATYIERLRNRAQFVTCTGHDIKFVLGTLTPDLFPLFDAHVLESGSAIYRHGQLRLLPTPGELAQIWKHWDALTQRLVYMRARTPPVCSHTNNGLCQDIGRTPHRDASITVYASDTGGSGDTGKRLDTVRVFVKRELEYLGALGGGKLGMPEDQRPCVLLRDCSASPAGPATKTQPPTTPALATQCCAPSQPEDPESDAPVGPYRLARSSVAIDVTYAAHSKWTGLKSVAGNSTTIGIGDSGNDEALHRYVGLACAPHNLREAKRYVSDLVTEGREFWVIQSRTLTPGLPRQPVLVSQAKWKCTTQFVPACPRIDLRVSRLSDLPDGIFISEQDKTETEGVIEILKFLDRILE